MTIITRSENIFNPTRWGLPKEAIDGLATRLRKTWLSFHNLFRTKTRDTSEDAYVYMRGLLTMDTKRNYANIARRVKGIENDGQNLQQFVSDSPWATKPIFKQIQGEVGQRHEIAGGIVTLDESGDKRAGAKSAGASRQYLGRLGKVDMGQVGVVLGYFQRDIWAMMDAQMYLPKIWFTAQYRHLRERLHIPPDLRFRTKQKIGLSMITDLLESKILFEIVACDSAYGDDHWFRAGLARKSVVYMADIRTHNQVYLHEPVIGIPQTPSQGHRGRPFSNLKVLSEEEPISLTAALEHMQFRPVTVRHTERGILQFSCAALRVWTVSQEGHMLSEWLFARIESDGTYKFSLSNAPAETSLEQLAYWRSARYFVERTIQDAKSEAGWDELVACKYRAWMHHSALIALVLWFAAQIKLDWKQQFPRDPGLASQMGAEVLPALSMSNIRELLKAVLPLKQLSPPQATRLVVKHLVARCRSTSSRLKARYSRLQQNPVRRI